MAISLANSNCSPTRLGLLDETGLKKQSMWHKLGLRRWLGRDDHKHNNNNNNHQNDSNRSNHSNDSPPHSRAASVDGLPRSRHDNLTRRLSRRVGVGLPRSTPFKRQPSERQDRLTPLNTEHRRAQSADRSSPLNRQRSPSPLPPTGPRLSAPEVQWLGPTPATMVDEPLTTNEEIGYRANWEDGVMVAEPPELRDEVVMEGEEQQQQDEAQEEENFPGLDPDTIEMDLDNRWILNLSMHFRDRSEREKFFITYVETPYQWRRVTISCDYRGAAPDSLEGDLKGLRYQRDKSARIYESIRDSLPDIQFYDTVTNLKLETLDGRLHVHVTEDVNEIIPYPPISSIGHLTGARCIPETQLHFDSHLSGFVYKVEQGGHDYIKKEIPGPDTVDEFLYEINALHALKGAPSVIQVGGIVVDEHHQKVKGLLISYAKQGALVDILYDQRGQISFARRERWAKQIVQGLCEIHESGYVQGDFTLSNIVVDADDNALIIDINRRGCPVGWEPPEIAQKIESNQRISMYIGVKTDLYQLGMTLWALAMQEDEPERQPRPLFLGFDVDVPDYYRRLVDICLSPMPRHRLSAKELLSFFPSYLFPQSTARFRTTVPIGMPLAKSNFVDHPPPKTVPNPNNPYAPLKCPNTQNIGIPPPMFLGHPDQVKRSTVTLADSNDGMAFPSRHSSASTLNHQEANSLDDHWNGASYSPFPEPTAEFPTGRQMQNAVPSVWENTASHGFSPAATDPQSQIWESRTDSDESAGGCRLLPSGDEAAAKAIPMEASCLSFNSTTASEPVSNGLDMTKEETFKPAPVENESSNAQLIEPPESSTSLFFSALPINPAISKRKLFPPDVSSIRQNENLAAIRPGPSHSLISLLADSQLPINPAIATPAPFLAPTKPESCSPSPDKTAITPHQVNTLLSESQLPINPALKISKRKSFPSASTTNPARDIDPVQPRTISDHLVSFLFESRLPINPAMGTLEPNTMPSESGNRPQPHFEIPSRPSPIHRLTPSLSESKLPINPAFRERPINHF